MIHLENVELEYNGNLILKNINIDISKPGIYLFYGESGSGKTSLLNIIGLMEYSFKGRYLLGGDDVSEMGEKEKEKARFEKITYLFQTPKLIENESIITNLELIIGKKLSRNEIKTLLTKINMKNGKKKVSKLSGGEKQRVNILMGLLRETPIIIGDEITSGLDDDNKKIIMKLLKQEAKSRIVILVSHDLTLINGYTKNVRKIENHTCGGISTPKKEIGFCRKKGNNLSLYYLFLHSINVIFGKKIRTLISIFSSTIALVCLGLCLILTTSLSDSVLSTLGKSINDHQILMEQKEDNYSINENISLEKKDMEEVYKNYMVDIDYIGSHYLTNMDQLFQDQNYFSIVGYGRNINLEGYSADSINKFKYLSNDEIEQFYCIKNEQMQEDEIVLSLSNAELVYICKELGVVYENEKSLLNFLCNNKLKIMFYLQNEEWDYYLEQDFYLIGYEINDENVIYHTNPMWNEYVVEEIMQLPYSLVLSEDDYYPWTVKKEYFFYVRQENITSFMANILEDNRVNDYLISSFKIGHDYGVNMRYAHGNYLNLGEINAIKNNNSCLDSYIPCTDNGYTSVGELLISGFAYPTYISRDYEIIEEYINMNSYSDYNFGTFQSTILSCTNDELISMNVLDAAKEDYCHLKVSDESEIFENNYNQISISRGLLRKLKFSEEDVEKSRIRIYILTLKEIEYANDKYYNDFEVIPVYITSVVDDDSIAIYCPYLWTISFSIINLEKDNNGINKAIFNYSGEDIEGDIKLLNMRYGNLKFSNPYLDYKNKIDEIGRYIVIGLSIFSSFCLLSTLLMLICSTSLFVSESKKEIGIYTTLGYSRKSIRMQFKIFSYFLSLYSFAISSVGLLIVMRTLQKGIAGIEMNFTAFTTTPFIVMGSISLVIGIISSYVSTFLVFREKPLKQLKN